MINNIVSIIVIVNVNVNVIVNDDGDDNEDEYMYVCIVCVRMKYILFIVWMNAQKMHRKFTENSRRMHRWMHRECMDECVATINR